MTPVQTSKWFADAAQDVRHLVAKAERTAGPNPSREFASTVVDLRDFEASARWFKKAGDSVAVDGQHVYWANKGSAARIGDI